MPTYYVDGSLGNDSNAGTSPGSGNAWATLQKAANTVAAGDTVYVKGGQSYPEQVNFTTTGSQASRIRFRGYDTTPGDLDTDSRVYSGGRIGHANRPIITGSNARSYCMTIQSGVSYYDMHNFVFESATSKLLGYYTAGSTPGAWRFWNSCVRKGSSSAMGITALLSGFAGFIPDWMFCELKQLNEAVPGSLYYGCEIHDMAYSSGTYAIGVGDFQLRRILYCLFYNLPGGGVTYGNTDSMGDCLYNTFYNIGGHGINCSGRVGNSSSWNSIGGNLVVTATGRPINWVNGVSPSYTLFYSGTAYYNCSGGGPVLPSTWGLDFYLAGDTLLTADPFSNAPGGDFRVATAEGFQIPLPPGFPLGLTSQRPFGASIGPAPGGSSVFFVED